ncbi:MAG: nitroreductase family protein [Treponema sp.]|nr:nitroreductase family protein [Treponema sp.]
MDFLKLAKSRYSVRKFKKGEVPQEIIDKILEAGMIAPTGC